MMGARRRCRIPDVDPTWLAWSGIAALERARLSSCYSPRLRALAGVANATNPRPRRSFLSQTPCSVDQTLGACCFVVDPQRADESPREGERRTDGQTDPGCGG